MVLVSRSGSAFIHTLMLIPSYQLSQSSSYSLHPNRIIKPHHVFYFICSPDTSNGSDRPDIIVSHDDDVTLSDKMASSVDIQLDTEDTLTFLSSRKFELLVDI